MKRHLGLFGTAVGLAAAVACGSSSSSPPAKTSDGTDANTPSDSGVGTNDDATAAAPPIMCGSATCSAPSGTMFPLSPCCLPNNGCGATFGTAAFSMFDASAFAGYDASAFAGYDASAFAGYDAASFAAAICLDTSAGTPDSSCPSQTTMGFTLTGCCATSGVCGVDLSLAGLGCNALSALAAFAPAGSAGDAGVTPPQACGAGADGGATKGSVTGDGSVP